MTTASHGQPSELIDRFGRPHGDLRISITDRCNLRCTYCMPNEVIAFRPRHELLTYEEIAHFVRIVAGAGIRKVRLTGGEPLVRANVPDLVARLVETPGIEDVALTTNGILLTEQAVALRKAGLHRLNISLDTLDEARFQRLTRREGIDRVLEGISAARQAGFDTIRLNAIAIRGSTEVDVVPLVDFARSHDLEIRFIEFMPLDADAQWDAERVLSGEAIRRIVEAEWGALIAAPRKHASQPARDFQFADGRGGIGFINPVSDPFCGDCNRLRLTADGKLRNCLFARDEWDVRDALRADALDDTILSIVRDCIAHKKPGHGIDEPDFLRPDRAMYQIGG